MFTVQEIAHVTVCTCGLPCVCLQCGRPGSGRSPGGDGNLLQYSCLENPMEPGRLQSMGSQSRTYRHVQLCLIFFVTPWTVPTRLLCPWDSSGKNTGVGCHALVQGIFPRSLAFYCSPGGFFTTGTTWESRFKAVNTKIQVMPKVLAIQ